MKRRRPDFLKGLRLRGRYRLGPAPDPDRRKRDLPPTATLEDHIEDLVGWMIAGGFSPVDARRNGEWIREFHRQTGVNFLTLPPEEQAAFVAACDREIDELLREEADELDDPEEQ